MYFIVFFILIIMNSGPRTVFAMGEYDGGWVGKETISVPSAGVTESVTTGTILYQTSQDTLALWDDMFGSIELVRSGSQWTLPSPISTSYMGYLVNVSSVIITFPSSTLMTGTISLTADGHAGTGSLSHKKQSCPKIANGQTISGISGAVDSLRCYEITLSSGAKNFSAHTFSGTGDSDLSVYFSRPPFTNYYSDNTGNDDQITVPSPASGKWYIVLYGWEKYADVRLTASYSISITPPPVSDFTANTVEGVKPLTVEFSDKSEGSVTTWAWDFGDGTTSTAQNPSHTYSKSGNYTVTLTVTGPGGTDSETKAGYINVKRTAGLPWLELLLKN